MKNIMFCILFFCFCISCKKTEVSGKVYSKNNTPLPNVVLKLEPWHEQHAEASSEVATTNSEGSYYFSFKAKGGDYSYYISCTTDSGRALVSIPLKDKTNVIDIHLQ